MAKKLTNKEETKTENLPTVSATALTGSAMAELANYDTALFDGIELDVADNAELFKNDLLIPKIWLVQTMSDLRKQKKADEGDFVDSLTEEVLVAAGGTLRFVVLKTFKRWHTYEILPDGSKEFLSSEIMVLGKNENYKYEDVVEGKKVIRRQVISAYVLIERDALLGINKPYIIDFSSTSKYAGRVIVSDIATLNNKGLPAFTGIFEMSAVEEEFEKGAAFVKKVKWFGFVPKAAMPYLIDCRKQLQSIENEIVMDDSDLIKGNSSTVEDGGKPAKAADIASEKI